MTPFVDIKGELLQLIHPFRQNIHPTDSLFDILLVVSFPLFYSCSHYLLVANHNGGDHSGAIRFFQVVLQKEFSPYHFSNHVPCGHPNLFACLV